MGRTSRKRQRKKKLSMKARSTENNEENSLMNLKFWLKKNSSSIDNLVPYTFPITGRGLRTLQAIRVNDILISIPYEALMSTATLAKSGIKNFFLPTEQYSAQCSLSVFIIYELHLGNVSKWYHYINCLPPNLTNPDFCTQREKDQLPMFIKDYMHETHKVQNDYRLLVKSMNGLTVNGKGTCPHCNLHFSNIITFERYKWAYYIVNTRAIYVDTCHIESNQNFTINVKHPNNLALAPFLDLFNHNFNSATHATVVRNENGQKYFQITTLKPYVSGSQVFINYGAHNSLKLYVHYGFFIPNNPLDEVQFDISDIQACIKIPRAKIDFIISSHLHKNMAFTRQGLNYNAVSVLFVINTNLVKNQWKRKIYGNFLTSEEIANACITAKQILHLKKCELENNLIYMRDIKSHTESYSIAISLLQEYITILTESYKNL